MLRLLMISMLFGLVLGCASAPKKKAKAARKDVNAEEEKKEKKQSYEEAWRLICNAEKLAGASPEASRQERATLVA